MSSEGHQRYRVGGSPDPAPSDPSAGHQSYRVPEPPRVVIQSAPAASGPGRRKPRLVPALAWLYALAMLVLAWLVLWARPEIWPVHAFLYGPRWVLAAPLALLVPLVAWAGAWSSFTALATAALALIPITGLNLPIGSGPGQPVRAGAPGTLRILSANVLSQYADVPKLVEMIDQMAADLVVFQECALDDSQAALRQLGKGQWHYQHEGEFFLASRFPLSDFQILPRSDVAHRVLAARVTLQTPDGPVPVVNLHLFTPRDGLTALIHSPRQGATTYKQIYQEQQTESEQLRAWLAGMPPTTIVAGDFNLTVEHPIYQQNWAGLGNAFTQVGWGLGHTKFTRVYGTRIDHVLFGPAWQALQCEVGPPIGSDHRPVLVVLGRTTAPGR